MSKPKFQGNIWDLFFELVRTDFIMRYHNSILGFIWVLLKPFLIFLILVAVFSWFFKSQDPFYHLNLLLGLLIYSYFAESTLRGVTCLHDKASIILKVNFPKIITLFTSAANSFISFFAGFLVFLLFWSWEPPQGTLLNLSYFFLLIIILTILTLGLNFFISLIYIKLKDLFSIWEVLLQLIFYGSPIIYPLTTIPEKFQQVFLLNPLAIIVTESQKALITGKTFSWRHTYYAFIISVAMLILGFLFFKKYIKKIAESF